MNTKFPKAGGVFLESMTACGRIKAKHLTKAEQKPTKLHAPLTSGGRIRVLVSEAKNKKDIHFHVDISKASYFSDEPPRVSDTLADVAKFLLRFIGKPIEVAATGKFAVPLKKIKQQSLVRLLQSVSVGPENSAHLIGALYEVDAEPVVSIRWHRRERSGSAQILAVVDSLSNTTIDHDYFDKLAMPLESALRTMVLEERAEQ